VLGRPSPAQLSRVGDVSSEIGPFDIFAARLAVEAEIAAEAAENATPEDIADMADSIEQMRIAAQSGRSTKPANQRFHMALAIAAKNPMLLKIVRLIWAEVPRRGPIWAKLDARRQMRPTRVTEHELILRDITERNPDHARAATRAHLQAATKDYLEDAAADPTEADVQVIQETDC
jgi:DNA-binding FadR family transcriptional regulator